jgi:hypothetical protein
MAWWQGLLDGVGVVVLLAGVALAFLFVRRRVLSRSGGTFECSVRMRAPRKTNPGASSRGWTLGVARYSDASLEWFRIFSFSLRPKYTFPRALTVLSRRTPHGAEAFSLYGGHVVVAAQLDSGQKIELAMSDSALTGFLAWTEAAPPRPDRIFE